MTTQEIPVACVLEAIPETQRDLHESTSRALFTQFTESQELDNGYQFTFSADLLLPLAQFIALERLCCPFWDFALHIPPGSDQVVLTLSGGDGVKGFFAETYQEVTGS